MLKKFFLFWVLIALIYPMATAQQFVVPFEEYSIQKTTYIHLEDGTKLEGRLKSYKWKRELLRSIKIKMSDDQLITVQPEEIDNAYLPINDLEKLEKGQNFMTDLARWGEIDLNKDIMERGYVYLEKSEVKIRKKTHVLLLQLLNPSFSKKVKVYHDPRARDTNRLKLRGVNLAGGIPKSYFVKKVGDEHAYLLRKRDYKKAFKRLFGDCPTLMEKYGKRPKWADFETHLYEYTTECDAPEDSLQQNDFR